LKSIPRRDRFFIRFEFLGFIETPFELRDGQNSLKAKIRSTGVFVSSTDNHEAVQQVDFAI
jgi:hypothetical protein